MSKQMTKKPLPPFEESLKQLESLVTRLEGGNLSLDESLATYQDGVALIRHCNKLLHTAEQKIEILRGTDDDGQTITTSADPKEFRTKSEHEA